MKKYLLLLLPMVIFACKDVPGEKKDNEKTTEARIGETDYYVELPASYAVRRKGGEDYSVYYFMPSDTLAKPAFAGGLYIGHYPTEFQPTSPSCRIDSIKSELIDTTRQWKVFICDSSWFAQTIFEKDGSSLHAFGKGNDSLNLQKAMAIFKTIHKK